MKSNAQLLSGQRSPWLLQSIPLLVITLLFLSINLLSEFGRTHAFLVDLTVYNKASEFIAAGRNPYDSSFDWLDLRWQYPPFALLPFIPLQYIPWPILSVGWILLTGFAPLVLMMAIITARLYPATTAKPANRVRRILLVAGLSLAGATGSMFINSTYLGQISMVLAAIVLYDLAAPASWKRIGRIALPKGIGVGVATAIKLTPGIFIIHLLLTRQWKPAFTAIGTLITSWTLGFIVFPAFSIHTFLEGGLFTAATENSPARLLERDNISAAAAFDRFRFFVLGQDYNTLPSWPRYLLILVLAALVLAAAAYLHRHGQWLYAIVVIGIGSALVSPVAWLNHGVWLILVGPMLFLAGLAVSETGAVKRAGRFYLAGFVLLALTSFPSQFRPTVDLLPTPWNGWYFTFLMIGAIAVLLVLGRFTRANRQLTVLR